jgi:hypothetical protein
VGVDAFAEHSADVHTLVGGGGRSWKQVAKILSTVATDCKLGSK